MTLEIIIFSFFGSLLGKLLVLRTLNELPKKRRPDVLNLAFFVSAVIDVILGIAFTYVQFRIANSMNLLLAIQISATAPLIGSSILKNIPTGTTISSNKSEEK